MHDSYLLTTPLLVFPIVALTGFVGCDMIVDPVPIVNVDPPSYLLATPASNRIDLAWDASPDAGVTGYNVKRGMTSGQYTLTIPLLDVQTYSDTDVIDGMTYFYIVTALFGSTESGPTNEVSVTPHE
jgi:fibronectin type 3 domain-containing protein